MTNSSFLQMKSIKEENKRIVNDGHCQGLSRCPRPGVKDQTFEQKTSLKILTHAVSTFWRMPFQFLKWEYFYSKCIMHCVFTLVTNLGLAELAQTMHAFSACVNSVSQLGFKFTIAWHWIVLFKPTSYYKICMSVFVSVCMWLRMSPSEVVKLCCIFVQLELKAQPKKSKGMMSTSVHKDDRAFVLNNQYKVINYINLSA